MVGESDTVSRTYSAARNGLIWLGGFIAVFMTIFVVATAFDAADTKQGDRSRARGLPRSGSQPEKAEAEEPSMGLSPDTVRNSN